VVSALTAQHGYGPTVREIMEWCGYRSTWGVQVIVTQLIADGRLTGDPKRARTLRVAKTVG